MTEFRFPTVGPEFAKMIGYDPTSTAFELGSTTSDAALNELCANLRTYARGDDVAVVCEPAWEFPNGYRPDPVGVDVGVLLDHDYTTGGSPLTLETRLTFADMLPNSSLRDSSAFWAVAQSLVTALNRLLDRVPDLPPAPAEPPEEHQIVVVFDVTAPSRLAAAQLIADTHNLKPGGAFRGALDDYTAEASVEGLQFESWWFPEQDLKQVDGNDCAAMVLHLDDQTF